MRHQIASMDYIRGNKRTLKAMSSGRPPKARVEVPDGFEIHPYGNQKNNIWEMQKEQMRKVISTDQEHFYTYSKEYLGGQFPLVNVNEIKQNEKKSTEALWITKKGFDKFGKKANWN